MKENKAINPKPDEQLTDYAAILMPARSGKIKSVRPMPKSQSIGGMTDRKGNVYIPVAESAMGRVIRYHEAMHAQHTPKGFKPKDAIDQSLEDARMHAHLSNASSSQYGQQARRDELFTALKDLRGTLRHPMVNHSTSVVIIRATGILLQSKIKSSHAKLLARACAKLGVNAQSDFIKAINALDAWDGKQDGKAWQLARKIVAEYFRKDFTGPKPEDKPKSIPQPKPEDGDEKQDSETEDTETMQTEDGEPSETEDESEDETEDATGEASSDDSEDSEDEQGEDGNGNSEDSEDESEDGESSNGKASEDETEDETTESGDSESEDSEDGSSEDESEECGKGKSDINPEDIAPTSDAKIKHVKKPKAKESDEYQGDLTPACDSETYTRMQRDYPLKLHIKRLDMGVNRVKLDMGRKAPLPVMSGGRILARKLVPALTTPGVRVFARTVSNGQGGSILIDNSGSMSIPESTLVAFLEKAPALTIGYYNAPNDHAEQGSIYIYAANGYRANLTGIPEYKRSDGGGNVIDYQAMAWLIKQPAPRYLVGDLGFTGWWSGAAHGLVTKLVASKQLVVVPNLATMEALLQGKAKPNLCVHNLVASDCHICAVLF